MNPPTSYPPAGAQPRALCPGAGWEPGLPVKGQGHRILLEEGTASL